MQFNLSAMLGNIAGCFYTLLVSPMSFKMCTFMDIFYFRKPNSHTSSSQVRTVYVSHWYDVKFTYPAKDLVSFEQCPAENVPKVK
jgi:hypothetical protein